MSRKKWQVLTSKYKLKNKFFKVRLDVCRDLQGKKINYFVIENSKSVGIIALTQDKKIILQRQYRHPINKWVWQIPAGHVEKGENTRTAIKREFLEESGYKVKRLIKLNSLYPATGKFTNQITYYLGLDSYKVAKPNLDHGEDLETISVDLDQALEMIQDGSIQDMDTVAGIFTAQQYLQEFPHLLWTRKDVPQFQKRRIQEKLNRRSVLSRIGF